MNKTICPNCSNTKDRRSILCRTCADDQKSDISRSVETNVVSRICRNCKEDLPIEAFRIRTRKTPLPRSYCKACECKERKQYVAIAKNDPVWWGNLSESKRNWNKSNPEKTTLYSIRGRARKIGVTEARMEHVVAQYLDATTCPICNNNYTTEKSSLHRKCLDHNHLTGIFRDVICSSCNFGLGNFSDDQDNLLRAIQYLQKFS